MKCKSWNLLFMIVTIIILASSMWIVVNRFLPIQEGWMQYYSLLIQKGFQPYKDFYFFTQPIFLFIVQLISKLGDGYILFRYYGMIERIILIIILYCILSKHFSPVASFVAIVASTFLYQSFNIDIFYSYYQTTLLFFFLALLCLQRIPESKHPWIYNFLVGVFASLTFFTKQSCGLFISVFLLIMMIWFIPKEVWISRLLNFSLGWAFPSFFVVIWLEKNNLFAEYVNQVFGGISAKGSILTLLFAFWTRYWAVYYLISFLLCLLILFTMWKRCKLNFKIKSFPNIQFKVFNYLALFAFPAFALAGLLLRKNLNIAMVIYAVGEKFLLIWHYYSFFLLLLSVIYIGFKWVISKQLPFTRSLTEIILAAFVWAYSTGMSGQLDIHANLLGTAIVFAFLFDRLEINWKHLKFSLLAISCLILFVCIVKKNFMPYAWWGWTEYEHKEEVSSIIPAFKDFKLSYETARIYDGIYLDIINNTTSDDYVFTYPYLALFNYVTNRLQPTFSPVHYYDVCPDYVAVMDANTLMKNPPKMIIYMQIPEKYEKIHEELFRGGQKSGQREIEITINKLVEEYNYTEIDSFFSIGWNWPIHVWVKPSVIE